LDTRTKIVEPRSIPRDRPVRILVCHLDPLWADTAAALREQAGSGATVVVAVTDPPEPLLPLRARAELAASLYFVDYVVTELDPPADAEVVDLRTQDLERRQGLVRHVLRRHGSE
jgi:hypothetical protein